MSSLTTSVPAILRCPTTGKDLKCFFVVYSPKVFVDEDHKKMLAICESSPHAVSTIEWGSEGRHKHANYVCWLKYKDAYAVKRQFKLKEPEYKVKAVTSVANAVNYVTKEGKPPDRSLAPPPPPGAVSS